MAIGLALTGVAVAVSRRLHPTPPSATSAIATAEPSALPSDPPWTVPLPTVSASPTTSAPSSASPSATPRPPRRPRTTPRTEPSRVPVTAAPRPKPTPTLLGPGGDDVLQASLTAYCVAVRGELAVAVRSDSADGWDCRHAERNSAIAMSAACRFHYGDAAWAQALDDDNPYSWRCFQK